MFDNAFCLLIFLHSILFYVFVSVANGDVMPLKGMIVGNNKTKK